MTNFTEIQASPSELFEEHVHLAEATLYRLLKQPHSVARSKSIEFDDLLQYASLGLWRACTTYKNKSMFETHAINHIRWAVMDGLNKDCNQFKYNYRLVEKEDEFNVVSFDAPVLDSNTSESESSSLHDTVADSSKEEVSQRVARKAIAKRIFEQLTDREEQIIKLRSEGYNGTEIATRFGVSKQAINKSYRGAMEKINRISKGVN